MTEKWNIPSRFSPTHCSHEQKTFFSSKLIFQNIFTVFSASLSFAFFFVSINKHLFYDDWCSLVLLESSSNSHESWNSQSYAIFIRQDTVLSVTNLKFFTRKTFKWKMQLYLAWDFPTQGKQNSRFEWAMPDLRVKKYELRMFTSRKKFPHFKTVKISRSLEMNFHSEPKVSIRMNKNEFIWIHLTFLWQEIEKNNHWNVMKSSDFLKKL